MKHLRPCFVVVWWLSLCLVPVPAVWAMPFVPAIASSEQPLAHFSPSFFKERPSFAILHPLPSESRERWLQKARSIGSEVWNFWFHSQKQPLSPEACLLLLWLNTLPAVLLVALGLMSYLKGLRE